MIASIAGLLFVIALLFGAWKIVMHNRTLSRSDFLKFSSTVESVEGQETVVINGIINQSVMGVSCIEAHYYKDEMRIKIRTKIASGKYYGDVAYRVAPAPWVNKVYFADEKNPVWSRTTNTKQK